MTRKFTGLFAFLKVEKFAFRVLFDPLPFICRRPNNVMLQNRDLIVDTTRSPVASAI